jgi:hypothetical protein
MVSEKRDEKRGGGNMNPTDMQLLRDLFKRCNIILGFSGPFSQSVIEELGDAIRRHLEAQTEPRKRISDVFAVYIELTQNIRHYAETTGADEAEIARLNASTVLIARKGERYEVISGNLIRNEDADGLSERLETVAYLDADELKAAYKERLRAPIETNATGAGLGFLQMARKASAPIEFDISDVDDRFSFFSLTVTI